MGWKEWPYWLKGIIIISPILIILFLLSSVDFGNPNCSDPTKRYIECHGWYPLAFLRFTAFPVMLFLDTGNDIILLLVPLAYFILVGAIVGWIYGKIKSRKTENVSN